MSALAEQARSKAREKVERLTRKTAGPVDASGWREPLGEKSNVQTGPRPVSRRQFRAGGKVQGGKFAHAGRKPRASGGMTANEYLNRNVKSANESRDGEKQDGGMQKGGRAHKATGGGLPAARNLHEYGNRARDYYANRHGMSPPAANEQALKAIKERVAGRPVVRAAGGRAHKATGGNMTSMALPQAFTPVARAEGGRTHGPQCHCSKCGGGAVGKKAGGSISDGTYQGTRPQGGRLARASGGRSKKGTTVNIIIAPGGGAKPIMPPPGVLPPPGPVGMHQGAPPPMPPGGAPPPMGPPPMMRKHGGRAYPIEHGAGGGKGRLEKARAYGA